MKTRNGPYAGILAIVLGLPAAALAPATSWSQIEEVIVTSRKQEESLQDIPLSVEAFDAETLEKQGLATTSDIVKLIPGVQFDQAFSAADTRISIRGINSSRGRTSVAILVDGVDVTGENVTSGGGSSLLNSRLIDLERVEVVKGPQSALYGRNAFAGAINYITKKPSMDGLKINTYGDIVANYAIYDVRGSISMPVIADKLAISINAGAYSSDGYYDNHNPIDPVANTGNLGGGENQGIRFAALWQATDAVSVDFNLSYSENKSDPRAVAKVGVANTLYKDGIQLPPGTPNGVTGSGVPGGGVVDYGQWLGTVGSVSENDINLSRTFRTDSPFAGSEDDTLLSYVRATWEADAVTFKSLTSYLDNSAFLNEDVDFQNGYGTPISREGIPANASLENDYLDRTDTAYYGQEFTLESSAWDRGRWLVGVSGFWEDTKNSDESIGWFNSPDFPVAFPLFCDAREPLDLACTYRDSVRLGDPAKTIERESESYSIFALVGYDITDALRATVEARYMRDEIKVTTNTSIDRVSQYVLVIPIDYSLPLDQLPVSATQKSDTINPRFALDYTFNDDVMVYASAAKGTKPAGFGTAQFAVPDNTRVDQEQLWGYELGAKTQWLGGTVQANGAIFYNDYTDRQVGVTVIDPVSNWASAGVVNAGGAETKGIELDLQWQATDFLTLGLGYAYTDAEWTDYNFTTIRAKKGRPVTVKDKAICGNAEGDCAGAAIAGVPENSLSLVANYTAPLAGDIEWFLNAAGQYEDKRAVFDRIITAYTDSYVLVDAQLGIQTDDWSVQLYADNLFDDDTVRYGQGYQDFRDGMYGGSSGGEPRDETVFAFLPPPRVVGVRATYRFGN